MKIIILKLLSFSFIIFFILFSTYPALALVPTSSDAIAIRVIPNPEHYSPLRWYKDQGFTGSPQSLTVDGYEAIRDGRTVYISSANVTATNLFTNIYLISYNQEAENATADIFSRIIKNWKFNSNITNPGNCSEPIASNKIISNCTGTVGCWHFDGDFKDSSGNGNDGIESGGVSFSDNSVLSKSARFDGINDLIKIDNSDFKTSSFTVSVWLNHDLTTSNGDGVLGNEYWGAGPWQNGYMMRFWMPGNNTGMEFIISNNHNFGMGSTKIPLYEWTHIAISYDSASCTKKIYKNGILISSPNIDCTYPYIKSLQNDLYIGFASTNSNFFHGLIDEVKIYDKALLDSEIKTQYDQAFPVCLSDSECLGKGYCNSPKANITRDTKRLAELTEIKIALDEYKEKTGKYPVLSAGTYLQNKTVSTWPSWTETLSKELGVALPIDPLNKLGQCTDYDAATCWNETDKKFNDPTPNDGVFNLPADSKAFVYSASTNGSSYDLCSLMESGYLTTMDKGACAGSAASVKSSSGIPNRTPQASCSNIYGEPNTKFSGFLSVFDADNDKITAEFNPVYPNTWGNWEVNGWQWAGGAVKLIAKNTGVAGQLEVFANKTGQNGEYKFKANVGDGEATSTIECIIYIESTSVMIDSGIKSKINNIEIFASSTLAIAKDILTAWQPTSKNYPLTGFIIGALPAEITAQMKVVSDTFVYYLSGVLSNTNTYSHLTTPLTFTAQISDKAGSISNASFKVTVKNNPPKINFINCQPNLRITVPGKQYDYKCVITASDTDTKLENNNVNIFDFLNTDIPDYPANMDAVATLNTFTISGFSTVLKKGNITVKARDEYGQLSQPRQFALNVNNYCGDEMKQMLNDEKRGGPPGNGAEDCDNLSGVAANPADSSPTKQYACTGDCPEGAGNCGGTCAYTGGWCGDGIIQDGTAGTGDFGEKCETSISDVNIQCNILKNNNIKDGDGSVLDCVDLSNNLWPAAGLTSLYKNICSQCTIGCTADLNFDKLGVGCYLDANNNNLIDDQECQKGRYICKNNGIQCYDTFTDPDFTTDFAYNGGNPMHDECCRVLDGQIAFNTSLFSGVYKVYPSTNYGCILDGCDGEPRNGNNNLKYLQGPATGLGFKDLTLGAPYVYDGVWRSFYVYNCDEVCKMRGNRICIGVGLSNSNNISTACVYDTHDMGATCDTAGNLTETSCKAYFGYWSTHSCWDGTQTFPIKSTACYCK